MVKLNSGRERCEYLAKYLIDNKTTVRKTAIAFNISKSTVHKDVTERLKYFNRTLYEEVKTVLKDNKDERHIRGGMATKRKYSEKRK